MATTVGSTTPKRIHLLGNGRIEENIAGGTIKPGHLVMLRGDGKTYVHNAVGTRCETNFALEDALQGRTVDTSYTTGERVTFVCARSGDVIWAWLKANNSVPIGGLLVSAGDGTLQHDAGSEAGQERVAIALEYVDATDSNDVAERIRVRIM